MFRRILIPLDGSDGGEAILGEVPRVSAPDAEVFLLHVVPPMPLPAGPIPGEVLKLPDRALAYLERVPYASSRLQRVARVGEPAPTILQTSLELNADLIAMCTHGRGTLAQMLLGSVAMAVVSESALPVLLTRPGARRENRPVRRILAPVAEQRKAILDLTGRLAASCSAEAVLLHVAVPAVTIPGTGAGLPQEMPPPVHLSQPDLEGAERLLSAHGARVTRHVAHGEPVSAIAELARSLDADLIAMATGARRGLERLLLGSVSQGVLQAADRPVLLLRERA
jgi:nucleotide-binding universal stress UspA family protein